jgi:hypothetical protein
MIPWKDFLMGCIKKIKKHKEERDRSGKFKKTRRKEWRKEREEIFAYLEVPILMCSPLVGDAMGLPLWWDSPSGEPTHMGTSPTTAQDWKKKHCSSCPPHKSLHSSFMYKIRGMVSGVRSNYCKQ